MAKIPVTATFKTNGVGNSTASSYNTASITPGAGKLLILIVSNTGGSAVDPNSVSGAGCTFTKILNASLESGWSGTSVWRACPASPTTEAITIGYAASHSGCVWSIAEFDCDAVSGDNGAAAIIRALQEGFGGGTNTVTTRTGSAGAFADPGNATVHINSRNQASAPTQTPGTDMTELSDHAQFLTADGRSFHLAFNWRNAAKTSPQFTNNNSGTYGGSFFLEIEAKDAGGSAYTLTADPGSYTVTGSNAGLKWGHKVGAGTSSYAVTGSVAGLKRGYKVGAASASYAIAGQAATVKWDRKLAAAVDAYTLTGSTANMYKGRTMAADSGAYSVAGFATTLRKTSRMSAEAGGYTLVGSNATLGKTQLMPAGSGSYALVGSPATFRSGFKVVGDVGAYGLAGSPKTLRKGYSLSIETGTYTFSYQSVDLRYSTRLSAQSGSYETEGFDAVLTKTEREPNVVMIAEAGDYALQGHMADLISTTPVYRRIIYGRYGHGNRRLG